MNSTHKINVCIRDTWARYFHMQECNVISFFGYGNNFVFHHSLCLPFIVLLAFSFLLLLLNIEREREKNTMHIHRFCFTHSPIMCIQLDTTTTTTIFSMFRIHVQYSSFGTATAWNIQASGRGNQLRNTTAQRNQMKLSASSTRETLNSVGAVVKESGGAKRNGDEEVAADHWQTMAEPILFSRVVW